MSKRERNVATVAAAVIGALVLYEFVIDPQLTRIWDLDDRIRTSQRDLERATALFSTSRSATRRLSEMAGSGLRRTDATAESELQNSVREWAQESRMTLSGVKRERTEKEKDFNKITFRANGSGGIGQIGRFLYKLQTAPIPIRVTDMTINSRKDGTDDLAIVLSISTIYLAPDSDNNNNNNRPGARPAPPPAPARRTEVES